MSKAKVTETKKETVTKETDKPKKVSVDFKCSIRRKKDAIGLPGEDPAVQNQRIGSSIYGKNPLSGLTVEDEKKYLPEIIGISVDDLEWRREVKDYWNNISERIPSDAESSDLKYPGKVLQFEVIFDNENDAKRFRNAKSFEDVGRIAEKGIVNPDDVADYVLFKYCLKYSRVANNFKDAFKSPNILFYIYSSKKEVKNKHLLLKKKMKARNLFADILDDKNRINFVLRMFEQDPNDADKFEDEAEKHLFLENKIEKNPQRFIDFVSDRDLEIKSLVKESLQEGYLFKPSNTTTYYFGDNKDTKIGGDLDEAVEFLKGDGAVNKEIYNSLKAMINI